MFEWANERSEFGLSPYNNFSCDGVCIRPGCSEQVTRGELLTVYTTFNIIKIKIKDMIEIEKIWSICFFLQNKSKIKIKNQIIYYMKENGLQ